ncbi:MFS-type transporter clz9-like [Homalodisca vitripennis]|uniref:MFS-type transporter clz9-like n=1 Tax=Homalodisca vitripennis TaxID=197043 RepID=UPI001EEA0984|nr:MFS-type transporter clz9-like [Homalodisca vitripennis]
MAMKGLGEIEAIPYIEIVRNRPWLTQKAIWTNEMMKAAIKAVKEDSKKLRETARFYNIPVMTLRDRLQTNNSSEAQLGRKPKFTKEQENDIAQQKPGNILGPKGVKQVGAATSWERGKNITICCAFSAAGTYIPPMFIFPRLRMSPLLKKDINAIYECSKNGWINEDLFLVWLDHFIAYAKPTKESPVLLIMDNHTTHTTLAAYNKCKDNNILVVTIPPHTSHRLQPLDVTFYSSLKAAFARECDSFMKVYAFTKITPYDIASLFNKAYIRVANIEKGVSGFDKTGIFPLDTETFSEEDFTVLNPNESALVSVVDEEPQKNIHEIAVPTVGQVQHEALNHGPKPSTSRHDMDVDETNPNEDLHPPKNISFSSSEDEDKCKEIILCDDNEMDDVDLLSFGDSGAIS